MVVDMTRHSIHAAGQMEQADAKAQATEKAKNPPMSLTDAQKALPQGKVSAMRAKNRELAATMLAILAERKRCADYDRLLRSRQPEQTRVAPELSKDNSRS